MSLFLKGTWNHLQDRPHPGPYSCEVRFKWLMSGNSEKLMWKKDEHNSGCEWPQIQAEMLNLYS